MLKLADLLREALMGMKTRAEREEVLLNIGATADEAKAACDALEEMEAQGNPSAAVAGDFNGEMES